MPAARFCSGLWRVGCKRVFDSCRATCDLLWDNGICSIVKFIFCVSVQFKKYDFAWNTYWILWNIPKATPRDRKSEQMDPPGWAKVRPRVSKGCEQRSQKGTKGLICKLRCPAPCGPLDRTYLTLPWYILTVLSYTTEGSIHGIIRRMIRPHRYKRARIRVQAQCKEKEGAKREPKGSQREPKWAKDLSKAAPAKRELNRQANDIDGHEIWG